MTVAEPGAKAVGGEHQGGNWQELLQVLFYPVLPLLQFPAIVFREQNEEDRFNGLR